MSLHASTFDYLMPTEAQQETMKDTRALFKEFASHMDHILPDGPDKTYVMRQLRDCAMWAREPCPGV